MSRIIDVSRLVMPSMWPSRVEMKSSKCRWSKKNASTMMSYRPEETPMYRTSCCCLSPWLISGGGL